MPELINKPDVPQEEYFDKLLAQTYWFADRNKYYFRGKSGIYNPLDKADLGEELELAGLFKDIDEENHKILLLRKADTLRRFMSEVRNTNRVDAVGKYAGYFQSGLYDVDGLRFLVEYPHKLTEPKKGDISTFINFVTGQLQSNDQINGALGWVQTAVKTLREDGPGEWRPGQVLALRGPSGTGKTTLQQIITLLLTGRGADPSLYFTGGTDFNSELAQAEHWAISDPAWTDAKQKNSFVRNFKAAVANPSIPIHGKGREIINLTVFKRVTISLNNDEEVFAAMEASSLEKMILLDCHPSDYAPTADNWKPWFAQIKSELPAILYYLLYEFEVPKELYHPRYGVRFVNSSSDELKAPTIDEKEAINDEIIMKAVLGLQNEYEAFCSDIHTKIFGKDSPVKEAAEYCTLPKSLVKLGKVFQTWSNINNGQRCGYRIEATFRSSDNKWSYKFIRTPGYHQGRTRV